MEGIAVYSVEHTTRIYILCGHDMNWFNIKACGTISYHDTLSGCLEEWRGEGNRRERLRLCLVGKLHDTFCQHKVMTDGIWISLEICCAGTSNWTGYRRDFWAGSSHSAIQKHLISYESGKFTTVSTKSRHWSISRGRWQLSTRSE